MARPTKYKAEMCQTVLKLMSKGASLYEVAAALEVNYDTLHEWSKDARRPEFTGAIKEGTVLSRAWWEAKGRTSLNDRTFCYVGWYMNMKNRFGWRDKHDVSGNVDVTHHKEVSWDKPE